MLDAVVRDYEIFLENEKKVSVNTRDSYSRDLVKFILFLNDKGIKDVVNVNGSEVVGYMNKLREKKKASSTISRSLASVRSYFRFLLKTNQISVNPTDVVQPFKVEKKEPQILSIEEVELFLKQPKPIGLKGFRDKAMLELLYATGMRVSELINLLVVDVNLEEGTVLCRKGPRERIIPVRSSAIESVKAYLEKSRPMMVLSDDVPYLFVNCNGRRLTRQGFWKIIKLYKDMSKIQKEITPHTLRHSFAFHLIQNGVDIKDVQHLLGHTDISSTNMYLQLIKRKLNDSEIDQGVQ